MTNLEVKETNAVKLYKKLFANSETYTTRKRRIPDAEN